MLFRGGMLLQAGFYGQSNGTDTVKIITEKKKSWLIHSTVVILEDNIFGSNGITYILAFVFQPEFKISRYRSYCRNRNRRVSLKNWNYRHNRSPIYLSGYWWV
jgi:hypothetical protein